MIFKISVRMAGSVGCDQPEKSVTRTGLVRARNQLARRRMPKPTARQIVHARDQECPARTLGQLATIRRGIKKEHQGVQGWTGQVSVRNEVYLQCSRLRRCQDPGHRDKRDAVLSPDRYRRLRIQPVCEDFEFHGEAFLKDSRACLFCP